MKSLWPCGRNCKPVSKEDVGQQISTSMSTAVRDRVGIKAMTELSNELTVVGGM